MTNKVLIKLDIPELDEQYDIFIPVNELVWKIKKIIIESLSEMTNINIINNNCILLNKNSCQTYRNNQIVINTDIRNGSELILLFNNQNS